MSAYTEAQFGATLLNCGPHIASCEECAVTNNTCPNVTVYRTRVYNYFFTLFPSMVLQEDTREEAYSQEHEWIRFWCDYTKWVET